MDNDIISKEVDDLKMRVTILEHDVKDINKKLDKIEGNTSKIIWILITAVALAVLNSVLKGGVIS